MTAAINLLVVCCIYLLFAAGIRCQKMTVAAPNTFRMGAEETVALNLHSGGPQNVSVYLRDIGGKHNFSLHNFILQENESKLLTVKVQPNDIPDLHTTTTMSKHYVILVVKTPFFHKELVVLVTPYSGYIFLQSDKPIYTPKQDVKLRIIPLNEKMQPDGNQTFKLQIKNPQNIIVEEILSSSKDISQNAGIFNHIFNFPANPKFGTWSAVVLYGEKIFRNSTVKFEVKEYVLPTFEVKVKVPEVILPHHHLINVSVTANYVYGEKVDGFVTFKFGVESESKHVQDFGKTSALELSNGAAIYSFRRSEFRNNQHLRHFPGRGSRLIVEATVLERATGQKEMATDRSAEFANSPYIISFKNCLRDFKAGLSAVIQADISYVNRKPAAGVKAKIRVLDENKRQVKISREQEPSITDEFGKVWFTINTEVSHKHLFITVETTDNGIDVAEETSVTHEMTSYTSRTGHYVALSRSNQNAILQVSKKHSFSIYSNLPNSDAVTFTYLIVVQGHIQEMRSFKLGKSLEQNIQVLITPEMSPSMRLVIFTVNEGELLSDSLKYDINDVCKPSGQISLELSKTRSEPGDVIRITLSGSPNTAIGLLAVDKAVYALRNNDLLTKEKMFRAMERHDLGCGPGGGNSNEKVLANAGIVVITDATLDGSYREDYGCLERKRKKREIKKKIEERYSGTEKICCSLGLLEDRYERTCEARADIIREFEGFDSQLDCAKAFLFCCNEALRHRIVKGKPHILFSTKFEKNILDIGRTLGNAEDELEFIDDSDGSLEREIPERQYFPETWIFDTRIIGSLKKDVFEVSVPHSITSWVIQAVGVSSHGGMCVADPTTLTTFRNIFIQLKLPYSVVRNEQIELQATVFNYGSKRLPVLMHMYGVEGLCTGAEPGERTERQRIHVSPNSAQTVGFPVVPLEIGDFPIQVVAQSAHGSDKITKMLSVVAEGVQEEKDIMIPLDPSNVQKRKRRHIVNEAYSVTFDEEKKEQLSIVKLRPSVDYIPDTESCLVTAIGDRFGSAVHFSLAKPENLIKKPTGCGEQTMAYMAPTLYILHYLKVTGKLGAQHERTAYQFVREGYNRELTYRKDDGSFSAFNNRPASTWLTAFVMKVFCQADRYVFIDENVVCSGLQWLSNQQNADGTFHEKHAMIHKQMMGGVNGAVPMTAFVLSTYQKCLDVCQNVDFSDTRNKALTYLEDRVNNTVNPYAMAIVAHALAVSGSEHGIAANEKLLRMSHVDEGLNTRHWEGTNPVETASFALLTNALYQDLDKSTSIVNWLNSKQSSIGTFWSTQDTVIALESLSEYAILAHSPDMNLVCNITSSNDATFMKTLTFDKENARVLRSYEIDKVGGQLYFKAEGTGIGQLGVKLRYNVPVPPANLCKFDLVVSVTEAKEIVKKAKRIDAIPDDFFDDDVVAKPPKHEELKKHIPHPLLERLGISTNNQRHGRVIFSPEDLDREPLAIGLPMMREARPHHKMMMAERHVLKRFRRRIGVNHEAATKTRTQSKYALNVTMCVRYYGQHDTDMAIIDAGIFTGFKAMTEDLKNLVEMKDIPISSFEETGRSVVLYLDQVPHNSSLCFWFRIVQEFMLGKIQPSIIQVYDYYNKGQTCTQFYSPDKSSPLLQTICTGRVCKCAEGGCPSEYPFEKVVEENQMTGKRNLLRRIACNDHDFVWKVRVMDKRVGNITDFTKLSLRVEKVLKEGLESADDVENNVREVSVRSNCKTGNLIIRGTYVIMGHDQVPIQDDSGHLVHRYYLDKKTKIHEWFDIKHHSGRPSHEKDLQKAFIWFENNFVKGGGCLE